jgi:hypothetical protein
MAFNYTAIASGAIADDTTFNAPLATIDVAIGNLSTLDTTVKSSLVASINEVHALAHTAASASGTTYDSWTINSDLGNVNADLIFGRTTGGNATLRWNGTLVALDKPLTITGDLKSTGNVYVNSDLTDANADLVFGRTTGGSATLRWNGTTLNLDAPITVVRSDDATTQVASVLTLTHGTTATAAAGFGGSIRFYLEEDAGGSYQAGDIAMKWGVAAAASYEGKGVLRACSKTYSDVEALAWTVDEGTGGAEIGFLGATPVVRAANVPAAKINYTTPDLDTEAEVISAFNTTNGAINSIITALINYGLLAAPA